MSRNYQDFYNLNPKSKRLEWASTTCFIAVMFFGAGLLIMLNPDYLPDKWQTIVGLNYVTGLIPIAIAVYLIRMVIITWIKIERKLEK